MRGWIVVVPENRFEHFHNINGINKNFYFSILTTT